MTPRRPHRVRAAFAAIPGGLLLTFLVSCASGPVRLESPACEVMRQQIREKQALDARVKTATRELRDLRKQGDSTATVSATRRLEAMQEQQRFLKDALDQSSRDCSPIVKDPEPVLDPAVRERQRLEGR